MAPERKTGGALSLLSWLCTLVDGTVPQRASFEGDSGIILDAAGVVVGAKDEELQQKLSGLRVVAINGDRKAFLSDKCLADLAQSGRPFTVDFAQIWTDYKHTAPWVVEGDPEWAEGKCGVYSIGTMEWSGTNRCCNCSGLVNMALRSEFTPIFEAILQYNEALRPAGGRTERILCCGSLAYLRDRPVAASRWMPKVPRAVIYQHLAQQLLEPETREELIASHPKCCQALEFLSSYLQVMRLEKAFPVGLCPGDLVIAPPGRGHTGHMYVLERQVKTKTIENAWILIESSPDPVTDPADYGLPQLVGSRRNVQSNLLEYWNPMRMPAFVLRLL